MPKPALGTNPLTRYQTAVQTALGDTPKTPKRKAGRPPAGIDGARVSDYIKTTLWLPPDTKGRLDVIARYLGQPQWQVIVDAVIAYEATLTPAARKAIGGMPTR